MLHRFVLVTSLRCNVPSISDFTMYFVSLYHTFCHIISGFSVSHIFRLLQEELEAELEELMQESTPALPPVPTDEPIAARSGLVL